jgi:hypothetical protein
MSKEAMEGVSKKAQSSRRSLMKRALIVMGASVLIQPAGAVFGLTLQDAPKKGDKTTETRAAKNFDKKKKGATKKAAPKKEETPKKEGRK